MNYLPFGQKKIIILITFIAVYMGLMFVARANGLFEFQIGNDTYPGGKYRFKYTFEKNFIHIKVWSSRGRSYKKPTSSSRNKLVIK